ncbi:cytochrome P450 71A6-like [Salvia splendens]|uniref:cytochrome P450 71A6-like n=1 Tax=Salvia splendens TaxID=180675 RepID=UPI001C27C694|nr:cytochrome P450 71A6-like [Salvia splendens]
MGQESSFYRQLSPKLSYPHRCGMKNFNKLQQVMVVEQDFVDILLDFQKENESGTPVDDDTIEAIILAMYAGGTDTTSTALEWAMAELIRNPTILKTLQDEIREAVGSKGEIEERDLEKMSYLKAVA